MAPKKKANKSASSPSPSPSPEISRRVTRGFAATAAKRQAELESPAQEQAKKPKTGAGKGKAKVSDGSKEKSKATEAVKEEVKSSDDAAEQAHESSVPKKIVIEACKQCNSFKTRALHVKDGLEKSIPGIEVEINPVKPRRGCFEIRDSSQIFLSLLNMQRPFTPMKNLDMDQVVQDVVQKFQALS
ncbi:putative selenoprotein, Rdx-type [Dioscorea sansibarensis]